MGWGRDLSRFARRAALVGILFIMAPGCGPSELEEQRARLEREHEARMADLERLEARLVRSVGTIRLWQELGARHERVSELACENASLHAEEIVAFQRRTQGRRPETRLARAEPREREASSN